VRVGDRVYEPSVADDKVAAATGRTWVEWFRHLDKWGANRRDHAAIAKYLLTEGALEPWWSQTVAVEYERARGLREVGQTSRGDFEVTIQRTLRTTKAAALRVFTDVDSIIAWCKDKELRAQLIAASPHARRSNAAASGSTVRVDLGKGENLVVSARFNEARKVVLHVQHQGLRNASRRAALKQVWQDGMDAVRARVEHDR